jgi:hypothetical protein
MTNNNVTSTNDTGRRSVVNLLGTALKARPELDNTEYSSVKPLSIVSPVDETPTDDLKTLMKEFYKNNSKKAIEKRRKLTEDPGSALKTLTSEKVTEFLESEAHIPDIHKHI